MQIKVCGMKDPCNMLQVAGLRPDMMGFIFYPPSARYAGGLRPGAVRALPPEIRKIGVFVDEKDSRMEEIAGKYGLDAVQFHGNESPKICKSFRQKGVQVIKAFHISVEADVELTGEYAGSCDYFLFDTRCDGYGGSGQAFDWNLLEHYRGTTPFLLSGGIAPRHAEAIKALRHPQLAGIDVNSCFEIAPGVKDPALLKAFMKELEAVWIR